MAEYLERPKRPLKPDAAEMADKRGCLKKCGHAPDYRCCCQAHEDSEQTPDAYTELTMNDGYRLARAYGDELNKHGGRADES